MFEIVILILMLIPQIVAGIFAKSLGRSFWFWFFISFLIPIISLIVLVFMEDKSGSTGFEVADHVNRKDEVKKEDQNNV